MTKLSMKKFLFLVPALAVMALFSSCATTAADRQVSSEAGYHADQQGEERADADYRPKAMIRN